MAALVVLRSPQADSWLAVALVTGANKGIGLQIAKELAAHGFTVLLGSRNRDRGKTAARSIGADAHVLQLDVTDRASIVAAVERIGAEFGRLDVLVNNAGISHTGKAGSSLEEIAKSGRAIEQAAREPVRLALLDASGPTGTFSDENGPIPW